MKPVTVQILTVVSLVMLAAMFVKAHKECYSVKCVGKDCLKIAIKDKKAKKCEKEKYGCELSQITGSPTNITTIAKCSKSKCVDKDTANTKTYCCNRDLCNSAFKSPPSAAYRVGASVYMLVTIATCALITLV